jgi:hypothetical protein
MPKHKSPHKKAKFLKDSIHSASALAEAVLFAQSSHRLLNRHAGCHAIISDIAMASSPSSWRWAMLGASHLIFVTISHCSHKKAAQPHCKIMLSASITMQQQSPQPPTPTTTAPIERDNSLTTMSILDDATIT